MCLAGNPWSMAPSLNLRKLKVVPGKFKVKPVEPIEMRVAGESKRPAVHENVADAKAVKVTGNLTAPAVPLAQDPGNAQPEALEKFKVSYGAPVHRPVPDLVRPDDNVPILKWDPYGVSVFETERDGKNLYVEGEKSENL